MLVRPDFYLYGAVVDGTQVNALVNDLAADLRRHGVRLDGVVAKASIQADEPLALHV